MPWISSMTQTHAGTDIPCSSMFVCLFVFCLCLSFPTLLWMSHESDILLCNFKAMPQKSQEFCFIYFIFYIFFFEMILNP